MAHLKFDLAKLEKLNDPGRFDTLKPEVMWAALGCPSPIVIVEIGAGTGLFSAEFARRAPSSKVYAADIEPAMVQWMRENRAEVAEGTIVPVLAEETRVPLADGVAGLVAMVNLHHELSDPADSYVEALRLLATGGQLLVVDWAPIETPKGPPLAVRVAAEAVVEMLQDAGFSEVEQHEGLPWHWLVTGRRP